MDLLPLGFFHQRYNKAPFLCAADSLGIFLWDDYIPQGLSIRFPLLKFLVVDRN